VRLTASSSCDRDAFEAWRAQSVTHEIAFEREMAAWEKLDRLQALHSEQAQESLLSIADETPPAAAPSWRKTWYRVAASLAVVSIGSAIAMVSLSGAPAYATEIGEHRTVRLDDGSSVDLNTDTKIVVRFARERRMIDLVRGEAMFHIARDGRPFIIRANGGQLDSSAAETAVRLVGDRTAVTVMSGTVLASPQQGASDAGQLVSIGASSEAMLANGKVAIAKVGAAEIDRVLAWRNGAVSLDGQTLSQAADEFNRYNMRKIHVSDATAGAVRVGGYFQSTDVDGFVGALTKAFPLEARTGPDGDIVVLSKPGKR